MLLAACGKSAEQCRTEARELGALLADIDTEPGPIWSTKAKLVARADLPRPGAGTTTVTLFAGRSLLAETEMQTPQKLREALDESRRQRAAFDEVGSRRHRPDPRRIYFLVDEATPWREVVAAVRAPMSMTSSITSSPTSSERAGHGIRSPAREASRGLRRRAGHLRRHRRLGNRSKSQFHVRRLADALINCKRDVPMADFGSTTWRLLVIPQPLRGLENDLELATVSNPAQLVLLATTPWSTTSKRLDPSTKNVQLVVE